MSRQPRSRKSPQPPQDRAENLPAAEDARKAERRFAADEKRLPNKCLSFAVAIDRVSQLVLALDMPASESAFDAAIDRASGSPTMNGQAFYLFLLFTVVPLLELWLLVMLEPMDTRLGAESCSCSWMRPSARRLIRWQGIRVVRRIPGRSPPAACPATPLIEGACVSSRGSTLDRARHHHRRRVGCTRAAQSPTRPLTTLWMIRRGRLHDIASGGWISRTQPGRLALDMSASQALTPRLDPVRRSGGVAARSPRRRVMMPGAIKSAAGD